jgi:hypothetical protein
MNYITEETTVSVQLFPTATTGRSGTVALDMSQYRNAIAKLMAHRLPTGAGEGVITLSIYQNTVSGLTGTQIATSVRTRTLTSVSDVYLESEIKTFDMGSNSNNRFIYAHIVCPTSTQVCATIIRGKARYDNQ